MIHKCPECGSSNMEFSPLFPIKGAGSEKTRLGRALTGLLSGTKRPVYPSGQYCFQCKNCGKRGVLFVN